MHAGGAGSLLRLFVLAAIMAPVIATVMVAARVPDAVAARAAVQRRLARTPPVAVTTLGRSDEIPPATAGPADTARGDTPVTYPERSNSPGPLPQGLRYRSAAGQAGALTGKGPEVNDQPSGTPSPGHPGDPTTQIPRSAADDFQPDVTADMHVGTVPSAVPPKRPNADFAGDPTREPIAFDSPREPAMDSAAPEDDVHLIPGASIAGGRYRLLVSHGGPPGLQFWQALDTALDRQVALTFVDPDRTLPPARSRRS